MRLKAMILAVMVAVPAMGCEGCVGSVIPFIEKVLPAVTELVHVIDAVDAYLPTRIQDPAELEKGKQLVADARAAVLAFENAGHGVVNFSDGDVPAAFDRLQEVVATLMDFAHRYGIREEGGTPGELVPMGASPDRSTFTVPNTKAILARMASGQ